MGPPFFSRCRTGRAGLFHVKRVVAKSAKLRFRLRRKLCPLPCSSFPHKAGGRLCGGPSLSQSPRCSASPFGESSTRSLAPPLPTKPGGRLCGGPRCRKVRVAPLPSGGKLYTLPCPPLLPKARRFWGGPRRPACPPLAVEFIISCLAVDCNCFTPALEKFLKPFRPFPCYDR